MNEQAHHTDEHTTHLAAAHHHSVDRQATEDVALHGSAHTAHATGAPASLHHNEHAGHSEALFQRPFWISLLLTIPVLMYEDLFQDLFDYTAPPFPGSAYLSVVLGSIIYWYGGWVFLRGADRGVVFDATSKVCDALSPVWLSALVSWVTGRATAEETAEHIENAVRLVLR